MISAQSPRIGSLYDIGPVHLHYTQNLCLLANQVTLWLTKGKRDLLARCIFTSSSGRDLVPRARAESEKYAGSLAFLHHPRKPPTSNLVSAKFLASRARTSPLRACSIGAATRNIPWLYS